MESLMPNVFTQISTGAVTLFSDAEKIIEADAAKVVNAVPSLGPELVKLVSDVKQGASDALGAAATIIGDGAAPLATGIENAAEASLAALTKGESMVLNPLITNVINLVVAQGTSALKAWALSAQASLSGVTVQSAE
jgi:hypothetical protein